jgi:hypothetical protein
MRNERQEINTKGLDQILNAKKAEADKSEDLSLEVRRKIGNDIRLAGKKLSQAEITDIIKKHRG